MDGILDFVLGLIGQILYPLFSIIFVIIDAIQEIFRMFAGLGTVNYDGKTITAGNSGADADNGLVFYLMRHNVVQDLLVSIALLALFLIIIFTVMAFIKNSYADKPKGWKEIVGNAIKGLFNFIFLPFCSLLAIWLGNILLQAIDGATSYGGATAMSRKLFIACSYNANRLRGGDNDGVWAGELSWVDMQNLAKNTIKSGPNAGKQFGEVVTIEKHVVTGWAGNEVLSEEYAQYYADIVDQIYSQTNVDITTWFSVNHWYRLWNINYLILIVGGVFILYVMGSLSFAMVRRIFFILALFIVSPGVCATYPLDEGGMVKKWKDKFKEQALSAYGAVIGMNIFFSILPIVDKIQMPPNLLSGIGLNDLLQLCIMVVGLLIVKDLMSMFSSFVGGEDAYGQGKNLMKSTKEAVVKNAVKTGKFVGTSWKLGKDFVAGSGKLFGSIKKRGEEAKARKEEEAREAREKEREELKKTSRSRRKGVTQQDRDAARAKLQEMEKEDKAREKALEEARIKEEEAKRAKDEKAAKRQETREKRSEKAEEFFNNNPFGRFLAGVGDALGGAGRGLKTLGKTMYEESALGKEIAEVIKSVSDGYAAQDKRDKEDEDGPFGINKVKKGLAGTEVKMSSDAIRQLGQTFGEEVGKRFFTGKTKTSSAATLEALGLDKKSSLSDLQNIDSIMTRLSSYASQINDKSIGENTRDKLLESAIKYASEVDTAGNSNLQAAVTQALENLTEYQSARSKDPYHFEEVDFGESFKEIKNASRDAGKIMAEEITKATKELIEAAKKAKK